MKKSYSRILSSLAAMAVCFNTAASVNAAVSDNVQPSAITVTADDNAASFTSDEEMLKYVRNQMKLRNEDIIVYMSNVHLDSSYKHYSDLVMKDLFNETGDPTEGKYLYLSLINNTSSLQITNKGLRIEITTQYRTTAAQEAELNKNIELVKTMLLANVDGYSDVEKIKAAYDKIVSNIKLSNDAEPLVLGSAYSALLKGTANDLGYVQLLLRALTEVGFTCEPYYTNYDSKNNPLGVHYLLMVNLDGVNYFLDPVWEYKNGTKDKFFLKGYKDLDKELPADSEYRHEHLTIFGITLDSIAEVSGMSQYSVFETFDKGDVNGDHAVNSIDASSILAEYARQSSSDVKGTFSAGQKKAGDLDNNGKVDSSDASVILSYYAYTSTTNGNVKSIEEFMNNK